MGTRFDKWLGRPATIRILRHLISEDTPKISRRKDRCSLHTGCYRRSAVASTLQNSSFDEYSASQPRDGLTRLQSAVGEAGRRKRGRSRVVEAENRTASSASGSEHYGLASHSRANGIVQQTNDHDKVVFKSLKSLVSQEASSHTRESNSERAPHAANDSIESQVPVNNAAKHSRTAIRVNAEDAGNTPPTEVGHTVPAPTNVEELIALVEREEQENGPSGLRPALQDLVDREIGIPVTGPSAEKVWDAFLRAATADASHYADTDHMKELLYRYAIKIKMETGQQYRRLHTRIVGHYLRYLPEQRSSRDSDALRWHKRFLNDNMARDGYIVALIEDVLHSVAPVVALEQWKTMYLQGSLRRLYSRCMVQLQPGTILYERMKSFLLAAGDRPTSAAAAYAIEVGPAGLASTALSQLATTCSTSTLPEASSNGAKLQMPVASPLSLNLPSQVDGKTHRKSVATTVPRDAIGRLESEVDRQQNNTTLPQTALRQGYSRDTGDPASLAFTRSNMSLALGAVHGISEKQLSDQFCARVFATKLFPFSMSLTSLRLLGVKRIGALSICEIAQRSHRPEEFLNNLKQVTDEGIMLTDSVFLRLLQHMAEQNDHKGYHALLQSDQHPDNYDDATLQTALLHQYEKSQQWMLVQVSLQALSFHGVSTKTTTWNALLRKKLAENDLRAIRQCYRSMCLHGVPLSIHTLRCIRDLLPLRRAGQRESHIEETGTKRDFVASAYMRAIDLGHPLSINAWRELLKRYGMAGDIDKLNRCILWLAQLRLRDTTTLSSRPINALQSSRDVSLVLDAAMQKAVIWWSWRAGVERQPFQAWSSDTVEDSFDWQTRNVVVPASSESWARGIVLLRDLKAMGIPVDVAAIRKAIRQQLWTIFGPGHSTRKSNDVVASRNTLSLAGYIKHIHQIWPKAFPIHERLITDEAHAHAALLVKVFGRRRSVSRKNHRYVDIRKWAATQHSRSMTRGHRNALYFRQAMRASAWSSYWQEKRAKHSSR